MKTAEAAAGAAAIVDDPHYLRVYRRRQLLQARLAHSPMTAGRAELCRLAAERLTGLLWDYEDRRQDGCRVGQWIPTVSGRRLWIEDPRPEEIDPGDIAAGLAGIPRFNRMTGPPVPYSVAQHSVLVSHAVPREYALHGLLHDAQEYVAHDLTSPLKKVIGEKYERVEARLKAAVAARFGLEWTTEASRAVKRADNALLATEVRDVTPHRVVYGPLPALPLRGVRIVPWPEARSAFEFLRRLDELYHGG